MRITNTAARRRFNILRPSIANAIISIFLFSPLAVADTASSYQEPMANTTSTNAVLEEKYQRILVFIGEEMYGHGGPVVLKVAHEALQEKHVAGEAPLVGLEDLWSHALQEGLALFNQPEHLWGRTTAEQTADMIGQTTIGPWQMTLWNIRNHYGPRYGIDPDWTDTELYAFCRDHPDVQAKMIIDYIQLSYETLGRRTPYAIQRYFWLEPFVIGELGQALDWTKSVVAKPPAGGTWQDLTPEMKADTGFYAKQILLGTPYTNSGLLFWLNVTGDREAIRDVLRAWRDQKRLVVAETPNTPRTSDLEGVSYISTEEPGGFAVQPDDVVFYTDHPRIHQAIRDLAREVAEEHS